MISRVKIIDNEYNEIERDSSMFNLYRSQCSRSGKHEFELLTVKYI